MGLFSVSDNKPNDAIVPYKPTDVYVETINKDYRRNQTRLTLLAVFSSNLFGLLIASIYEYLSLEGIVSAARWILVIIWFLVMALCSIWIWNTPVRSKIKTLVACGTLLALVIVICDFVVSKRAQGLIENALVEEYIQPQLVIDSVQSGEIASYHLTVENIGEFSILGVAVSFSPLPMHFPTPNELIPVTRILPRHGGTVRVEGISPASLSSERRLYAVFFFYFQIKNRVIPCLSSHQFAVLDNPVQAHSSFDPQTFFETCGDMRQGENAVFRDYLGMSLAWVLSMQPQGTIDFWMHEKADDGRANYVSIHGSKMAFMIDPIKRIGLFRSITVAHDLQLSFEPKARHYIAMSWDSTGPTMLFIDGRSIERKQ